MFVGIFKTLKNGLLRVQGRARRAAPRERFFPTAQSWIQSAFEPRRGAQRSTDFLQLHKDRNGPLAREVDQNLRGGRRRKEFYEQPPIGSGEITTMEATYPRNEGGLSLMLTFSLQMHRQIII